MQYFWQFWKTTIYLAAYILRERKKETKRAYTLLDDIERELQGVFEPDTKQKITVSYGIYNPMICDAFVRLHGRTTTEEEKIRLIHYFICSSLFDDFTDHHLITTDQLYAISFQPEMYTPSTFAEKAFLRSHLLLRNYVKDKNVYDTISHNLYRAQLQSIKQYDSQLPDETIAEITFSKGGNAVLLCRHYLNINASSVEEDCWYKIGIIIQLTDDLFDIGKDLQDGITTIATQASNANTCKIIFDNQVKSMQQLTEQLPYAQKRKQMFAVAMAGIYSFGYIAIENLQRIQGNSLLLPDLKTLSKKELTIDMEKISHLIKWIRYVYHFAKDQKSGTVL